ncbi:MAG TPA: ATP-binding protein [Candidatus Binataceae bacterium]|nr:ATP-binding protein [Candidatus Binataceae bacterium]
MREAKQLSEARSVAAGVDVRADRDALQRAAIAKLAELARAALGSRACVVAWEVPGGGGEAASTGSATGDRQPEIPEDDLRAARAALAAMTGQAGASDSRASRIGADIIGLALSDGATAVRVASVGGPPRGGAKTEAILELVGKAALAAVAAQESARSRRFWLDKAGAAQSHSAAISEASAAREAEREALDQTAAGLFALGGAGRFAALGEVAARALGCRRWLVAAPRDDALRIVAAAARAVARPHALEESSAIRECARTGRPLIRLPGIAASPALPEDEIFGAGWIVFPCGQSVIGLAEGELAAPGLPARAQAFGARLAPIVRAWIAEDALGEHRALVSRLALRMYSAIDDERGRIARDLHDDQAQLLAAAQLALEGGGEEARSIFRQIAQELRARTRELKPASLERTTLIGALEAELERLRGGGIRVHLTRGNGVARISAPVAWLCWQVAREALANAARHSGASAVEVAIERGEGCVRVVVRDNGHGMAPDSATHPTMGLGGIRERLELMGGKLEIESSESGTTLSAEIPEIA